jgi:hypothetical protein
MDRNPANPTPQNDKHTFPGPVNPQLINEELGILRAVEKETHAEKVLSFRKVKTEQVFDARMDIWNVQTDKNQYWVITNPTGVYAQTLFPSLDYAVTFHVGLAYRSASNQRVDEAEKEQDQQAFAWRRWEQAAAALTKADAPEEYQAVGILCRVCLLSFINAVVSDEIVTVNEKHPSLADFLSWSEIIAVSLTQGSSAAEVRAYLVNIAKAAWQLVDWLAHAADPTREDANLAIEATEYVLMAFGAALVRHQNGNTDR